LIILIEINLITIKNAISVFNYNSNFVLKFITSKSIISKFKEIVSLKLIIAFTAQITSWFASF